MNANPNYFSRSLVTTTVNNNTGASLGGRIFRDKTFFFGALRAPQYSRQRHRCGYCAGGGISPRRFFLAQHADYRSPHERAFPGNMIPANRITSPSKAILDQYISLPNTRANESRYGTSASTISNQYDIRVDQIFSTNHNLFGRFSKKDWDRISPTVLSGFRPEDGGSSNTESRGIGQLHHPLEPHQ